ncbi:M61 family metallopeptidase [Limnobacter sp.]|uniref:M61 family metallopeptidase n=1 Tax=Limnobacter sp. TaxID=2003368 RepID=UPI0035185786
MLNYQVWVADAEGHYLDVMLQWEHPRNSGPVVELSLPVWIPGSYLIREFSRHVVSFEALANGMALPHSKANKNTWQVELPPSVMAGHGPGVRMECKWRVYAWDLSVRGAHVDGNHAFFNGTSVFLCPKGKEESPVQLTLARTNQAKGEWTVACGLPSEAGTLTDDHGCPLLPPGGHVRLHAPNYDSLIAHPVEMGDLVTRSLEACGVPHVVAVYGADEDVDLERLCTDLQPVCEAQIRLFEPDSGQAPFERYVFMLHATDDGYGGLEHRNSTALLCGRHDLPQLGVKDAPKGYNTLMGLCSHEYFHSWNVKRIKPAAFVPYRLHEENYTRLLWIFEGFTSYYDDLMLARAGYYKEDDYLKAFAKTHGHVHKGPGRQVQSVAESSFEAWTKYYRQDENAPNAIVSYYGKGALVAFCLDASIRLQTAGRHSLDCVMRQLWRDKGLTGRGLGEHEFAEVVTRATGLDLRAEIATWTETTAELPVQELLAKLGYDLKQSPAKEAIGLGLNGQFKPEGMLVKQVINCSAAHRAGVSAGDVLVAVGKRRLTEANYKRFLQSAVPGQTVELIGFRAERLTHFEATAQPAVSNEWTIEPRLEKNGDHPTAPWAVAQ